MSETMILDGITFDRTDNGNEVATRGSAIVGMIVPDGYGRGGWVFRLDCDPCERIAARHVHWVRSRAEARAMLAGGDQ